MTRLADVNTTDIRDAIRLGCQAMGKGEPVELEDHNVREGFHARFRGDEVVAMENFGTDLTFFDPLD